MAKAIGIDHGLIAAISHAFFAISIELGSGVGFWLVVDLRPLPLSERQRDLARLCDKGRKAVPGLFLVESFSEGTPLLEWCEYYELEGVVSKRLSSKYQAAILEAQIAELERLS